MDAKRAGTRWQPNRLQRYTAFSRGKPLWVTGGSIAKTGEHYRLAKRRKLRPWRDAIRFGPPIWQNSANILITRPVKKSRSRPGETLYPPKWHYEGYKWGMAIDLNVAPVAAHASSPARRKTISPSSARTRWRAGVTCTGSASTATIEGNLDDPEMYNQPVPCMHCEHAPCEVVCPVAATVHSSEGLNEMVYNRCVGTRYCSNNCPYKVRRFNFYLYSDWQTPSLYGVRNPDVTVRSRGVMEKCSYCVQRIKEAKIEPKKKDAASATARFRRRASRCARREAIIFGDLNDPNSKVAKLQRSPRTTACWMS